LSFLRVVYPTEESEAMGQLETVEMEIRNGKWKWKTEAVKT